MIEVVATAGLATVQDGGRPGHMHEGVPPGGALVPELLARANAAARNAHGEAAIEVFGALTLATRAPLLLATDDGVVRTLGDGETWTIACSRARVRYVAVRGGIDVPRVLDGRGTLLVARLGGHEGRPLRKGDALRVGDAPVRHDAAPPAPDLLTPICVVPGPDLDRFPTSTLEALLGSPFEVSARSDRVGVRLVGAMLSRRENDPGDMDVSRPMVRGAIQVPASGEAIVLGPDHPTTGGYPVLATAVRGHVGALMARPVGARVRFARSSG
jgi:biotin-dependent carboxylase-like uncharacterized protein